METTRELLERARLRCTPPSYYRLAKVLGVSQQRSSQWKSGRDTFSDEIAVKVAQLLEIEPAYVLACVQAERTQSDEARRAWEMLAGLVAAVVLAWSLAVLPCLDCGGAAALSVYYVHFLAVALNIGFCVIVALDLARSSAAIARDRLTFLKA